MSLFHCCDIAFSKPRIREEREIDGRTGVGLCGLDTRTECIEERRNLGREEDPDLQISVQFQVPCREVRLVLKTLSRLENLFLGVFALTPERL